jgi:quinol monooxygenase YgiN
MRSPASTSDTSVMWRRAFSLANVEPVRLVAPLAGEPHQQARIQMIRVVAIITTNPGRRDELLAAFRANVPNVRAEKGCIEYTGHIDAATVGPFQADYGPDSLVVLESWESPEALRDHVAAPHMKTYSQKTKDLVAKRTIHVLSAID